MSPNPSVLEVRLRRRWLAFVAVAVPLFALLALAASAEALSEPPLDLIDVLTAAFFVVGLGGLLVVPGTLLLVRQARGTPDVRLDARGVVWGSDRDRDQSLDWRDVEGVVTKLIPGNVPERAFVLRIRAGRTGRRARSAYGRVLAFTNRLRYGTPYAISTIGSDKTWEEIRAVLGVHLPDRTFEVEVPAGRS